MFYEMVMAVLKAMNYGAVQSASLFDSLVVIYEWKEWRERETRWVTWRSIFSANEWFLNRLKEEEEFYKKQPYNWQPQLVGVVARGWLEGYLPSEGLTYALKNGGAQALVLA